MHKEWIHWPREWNSEKGGGGGGWRKEKKVEEKVVEEAGQHQEKIFSFLSLADQKITLVSTQLA